MKQYLYNIWILIDEAANVVFFLGSPGETISLHAAKARDEDKKWGCVLCKFFDAVVVDHCNNVLAGSKTGKNC